MSDLATPTVDLDLDAERPATFRLQGEVFRVRQLSYRAFAHVDEAFMRRLEELGDSRKNGNAQSEDRPDDKPDEGDVSDNTDFWERQLDAYTDFVEANIAEEDVPRFRDLRAREAGGIQQRDVHTLRRWLWEAQTGRPLLPPEASSPGPGSSDLSSRDESGPVEVVRPT